MAAPATYTESEFRTYLVSEVLGPVASELSWDADSGAVQNALNEALLALDESDIAEFDTPALIKKLRAFGRREIWRQAAQVTAGEIAVAADGASAQLQQVHAQCKAMYALEAQGIVDNYGGDAASIEAPSAVIMRRASACDPYTPYDKLVEDCIE